MNNNNNTEGFSLLELSIVLVIIGLIAGGITVGADMVRAAELRSVMTDINKYQTAVYTFKDKYMAIPGDMKNAVKFWGAQAGATTDGIDATCSALDHTTPSTGTATCNGNGDGKVGSTYAFERFRSVQQLSNAGLLEGSYTGVRGSGGANQAVAGQNALASKITSGAYLLVDYGVQIGTAEYFNGDYVNTIIFGATGTGSPGLPIIKPEEAWSIDTKLDDGKPGTGKLMPYSPDSAWATNCATTTSEATAVYNLSYTSTACQLHFLFH